MAESRVSYLSSIEKSWAESDLCVLGWVDSFLSVDNNFSSLECLESYTYFLSPKSKQAVREFLIKEFYFKISFSLHTLLEVRSNSRSTSQPSKLWLSSSLGYPFVFMSRCVSRIVVKVSSKRFRLLSFVIESYRSSMLSSDDKLEALC